MIDTHGLDNGNSGFTRCGRPSRPAGMFNTSAGGTEYFMSSNAADEAHGNGVAGRTAPLHPAARLDPEQHLARSARHPASTLGHKTLSVGLYVVPSSQQKVGDTPLIDCLNMHSCSTNFLLGVPDPFAPEHGVRHRQQRHPHAAGRVCERPAVGRPRHRGQLVGATPGPAWSGSSSTPRVADRSSTRATSRLARTTHIYPAIAVTPSGHGVMAFTLVGRGFYPSAAFASIDAGGVGAVQLAAVGLGPADGFSGTAAFNAPNRPGPAGATTGRRSWTGATSGSRPSTSARHAR